jgi:hypothetical protein
VEGEHRRRQVLHRQARELVYKVSSYFKRDADAGVPVHDVAKAQVVFLSLRHPPSFVSVSILPLNSLGRLRKDPITCRYPVTQARIRTGTSKWKSETMSLSLYLPARWNLLNFVSLLRTKQLGLRLSSNEPKSVSSMLNGPTSDKKFSLYKIYAYAYITKQLTRLKLQGGESFLRRC